MLGIRSNDPVGGLVGGVVATIRPSAPLREAARQLTREVVGLLVVVDTSGVRGVLSERDLVTAVAEGADLDAERVVDHATTDVVTVDAGIGISQAALAMSAADVRHLAVSRQDEIVGVVSARDLVGVLAEMPEEPGLLA